MTSLASEQTLRIRTCLPCTLENHHQIIRVLICDMHRPVKNRDGGPIAGVAFNGGGVSRQLGPDDNDPVSATHFPEASYHTIPPSPTQPSTTFSPLIPELEMGVNRKLALPKYPPSPPLSVLSSPLTERQNSPASESEDICAACKGAGEFVCCEGCPRVFHLLCCDPLRMQRWGVLLLRMQSYLASTRR